MSSSASALRSLRVVLAVLVVLGLGGSAFAVLPGNRSRDLATRFAHALDGQADMRLDDYLAPDAEVFLHGATTALSPPQFRQYLDRLKRNRHAFHASGPVYLTEDGAGWLLEIKNLSEAAIVNPPGVESPAQLWMQARIGESHITRLWIHFTVEALARLHIPADLYRSRAGRQDIPLPEAWQDGTAAMVEAAARRDPQAAGVWSESTKRALVFVVWAPLVLALGAAAARGILRKRPPARLPSGQMLARLAQMHSAVPAVRLGGSGEAGGPSHQ